MNNMVIALQITALGMGLVFAAIVLLWWLMVVLTAVTADKEEAASTEANPVDTAEPAPVKLLDLRAQAAAVAVAIALAEQTSTAHSLPDPPTAVVSPWQMGTRSRQLYQKGPIRRPRKIG